MNEAAEGPGNYRGGGEGPVKVVFDPVPGPRGVQEQKIRVIARQPVEHDAAVAVAVNAHVGLGRIGSRHLNAFRPFRLPPAGAALIHHVAAVCYRC